MPPEPRDLVEAAAEAAAAGVLAGAPAGADRMHVVIAGHVDHGKSTILGRLLADTSSLPAGKLEQVRATCDQNGKPFEYAFLVDALRDEQAQGITIDAARVFFKTRQRHYVIIDVPGHIELLKNMVTGAARAEAALLVIDAKEGVQENSRRHGYVLAMLGIRQTVVLVNKMDLVDRDQGTFETIVGEFGEFLGRLEVRPVCFIPVSGRAGDNVAVRSDGMPWYRGPTVLETLDALQGEVPPTGKPFRMPVQAVYKFASEGDDRRIVAGTVETGSIRVGDEVVFLPSGKKGRVKTIEGFHRPPADRAEAGWATGLTLEEQIYVTRGEIATRPSEPAPRATTRLRVNLFWLGKRPLVKRRDYVLKLGTARVLARLEEINRVVDTAHLVADERKGQVDRYEVADCVLKLSRAIACDRADDIAATGRFVLVDDFEIRGGGIVREALPDTQAWVRDKVILRNYKWERSIVPPERRAERYSQRPTLLLVTGPRDGERKTIAKQLEARLFAEGKVVYYLGIGSVLYGVDADIGRRQENRREHIRRLAEVANILLDAGLILIVTAVELNQEDLEVIKATVEPELIETIWVGDHAATDLDCDLRLADGEPTEEALRRIKTLLHDRGVIFRPW